MPEHPKQLASRSTHHGWLKHLSPVLLLALICIYMAPASAAEAANLPDGRAYELVTRYAQDETEVGLDGLEPYFTAAATNGDVIDWEGFGACCGATSGGVSVYQSSRGTAGWQAKTLSPTPSEPLTGLLEEQAPVFWSNDLSQTIFATPSSYAPSDKRAPKSGSIDLYLQGPTGALTWLSQGPTGTGTGTDVAQFEGATPNLGEVLFGTTEQLTTNATGLEHQKTAQYLYVRDVEDETTSLIDVDNSGKLISPYGARLGNAGPPKEALIVLKSGGTITHAVSEDGQKIFFESPPEGVSEPAGVEPHLYMRDLANNTTIPLDNPESTGSAQYQGASADGSLVFFTSDEGLDGASTANELYVFNTTTTPIGPIPPMSAIPMASGTGILGVAAISNDGSKVFFVASGVLANNVNSVGLAALANEPNLYMYETGTGRTVFVAALAPPDIYTCKPTCASHELSNLGPISQPDIYRPDATTPDGSVFVFTSSNNLAENNHTPTTVLTEPAYAEQHRLTVASTSGFHPRHTIEIGRGDKEELETVETIDSPTELTFSEYGPAIVDGLAQEQPEGSEVSEVNEEVYRYESDENSLTCVSCTPAGVVATGSATLGETGGGSYAPANHAPPMSENGSLIFFDSPDPLVPGMAEPQTNKLFEPTSVYEWENGTVSLIAEGATTEAVLNGTTPIGSDVFFTTRRQLTPGPNAGYTHIYDARVGGGFTEPSQPPAAPCADEACRAFGSPTIFSAPPGSAGITELTEPLPEASSPRFAVSKITGRQRAALARTGQVTLTVIVTAAGKLTANAIARLHGKDERVARASATTRDATTTTLTLRLSKPARAALAANKTLTLRLEVTYSTTGATDIAKLTVGGSMSKRAAPESHSHA